MTAGSEGAWVAAISSGDCGDLSGRASLIDPASNTLAKTVPLDIAPVDIASGFGSVWVGGYTCTKPDSTHQQARFDAVLERVDPQTYKVIARIPVGPFGVTGLAVRAAFPSSVTPTFDVVRLSAPMELPYRPGFRRGTRLVDLRPM